MDTLLKDVVWYPSSENEDGIETIAFSELGKHTPTVGRIVGFNGVLKGDSVIYKKDKKKYTVVMVSRLGDFGLSETGELPYTLRVSPKDVYLFKED